VRDGRNRDNVATEYGQISTMKFPTQCPLVLQVHVHLREGKVSGSAKDSVM
jgi:hypothetical protein